MFFSRPPTEAPAPAPVSGDISGRFDPTALERGAKALKQLDNSPHAGKALELTRLQEITRQKQVAKETEALAVQRAQTAVEKARVEGEERRRTLARQQELERATAQYKAQLESEANKKKLQEQQRQNELWLQQQHRQFLQHEEIRKKNEREISELKRRELLAEKKAEQEIVRARVQEEAAGRIKQERQNFDLHLQRLRASAAEQRETRLASINAALGSLGGAAQTLLDDRPKLLALTAGVTALAFGVYGSRAAAGVAGRVLEARLGRPQLVRETSRRTWSLSRLLSSSVPRRQQRLQHAITSRVVLPPALAERLSWTTNALVAARKNGTPFRHLLLHGHPGTGKTLFARVLAQQSGMDYAIMSGGDIAPLGGLAVDQLNRLFKWAQSSRNGLVLFIDEAEAFLRRGRASTTGDQLSENARNALSAFLYHTGTESRKFCLVLATNVRDILDEAVVDRIDEQFEFPLPGLSERRKMLEMFYENYITMPTAGGKRINVAADVDDSFLDWVAERTEGFSGRQLSKLVLSLQAAVFGSGTNTLTRGLANTVVEWRLGRRDEGAED